MKMKRLGLSELDEIFACETLQFHLVRSKQNVGLSSGIPWWDRTFSFDISYFLPRKTETKTRIGPILSNMEFESLSHLILILFLFDLCYDFTILKIFRFGNVKLTVQIDKIVKVV